MIAKRLCRIHDNVVDLKGVIAIQVDGQRLLLHLAGGSIIVVEATSVEAAQSHLEQLTGLWALAIDEQVVQE